MENLFDPQLMAVARDQVTKAAFVDASASGGDPAAAGGAPTGMDPMAMMGGGGGPADVSAQMAAAGGGGGALSEDRVKQLIQESMAAGGGAGATGAGGAVGPNGQPKKKVDVNTEIYQIKKLLIYLLNAQGVQVPPDMMLGDPADDPHADPSEAASDPASAGAQPGAMQSAINAIKPIQGASPAMASGGGEGGGEKQSSLRHGTPVNYSGLQIAKGASALHALIRQANLAG